MAKVQRYEESMKTADDDTGTDDVSEQRMILPQVSHANDDTAVREMARQELAHCRGAILTRIDMVQHELHRLAASIVVSIRVQHIGCMKVRRDKAWVPHDRASKTLQCPVRLVREQEVVRERGPTCRKLLSIFQRSLRAHEIPLVHCKLGCPRSLKGLFREQLHRFLLVLHHAGQDAHTDRQMLGLDVQAIHRFQCNTNLIDKVIWQWRVLPLPHTLETVKAAGKIKLRDTEEIA